MKTSMKVLSLSLLAVLFAATVGGQIALCYLPASPACNTWGTQNFDCPGGEGGGGFWKSLTDTAGQSANQCCLIAYTTSGNTGCTNDGPPIQCIW